MTAHADSAIKNSRWNPSRVARLGFLIGLGFGAKRVAEDPIMASTANNMHRQARRFGLAFRDAPTAMRKLNSDPNTAEVRAAGLRKFHLERQRALGLITGADDLYRLARRKGFKKQDAIEFANRGVRT